MTEEDLLLGFSVPFGKCAVSPKTACIYQAVH